MWMYLKCKTDVLDVKGLREREKERERGRGVCMTITTSVPLLFVLFMSGNFLAVLPG